MQGDPTVISGLVAAIAFLVGLGLSIVGAAAYLLKGGAHPDDAAAAEAEYRRQQE